MNCTSIIQWQFGCDDGRAEGWAITRVVPMRRFNDGQGPDGEIQGLAGIRQGCCGFT